MFPARVALTGLSGGPDLSSVFSLLGPGGNRKENPFLFSGLIPAGVFIFSNAPEILRCGSCLRKGIFRGFGK